jgi:hypothetical protein
MNELKKQRRQRAVLSCNDCRRRKLRCDRVLPCNRCIKGGIADICAYEPETHSPTSKNSSQRPLKRRRRSPSQSHPTAGEKARCHLDIPKLFNPPEFLKSDKTAEDRVKSLEGQVALLEQQLLARGASDIEGPRIVGTPIEEYSSPPTSLRGLLKGGHYGSFYHGPSSPVSVIASVSKLGVKSDKP